MKRHGNLFEQVVAFDNLLLAARKAAVGKKQRLPVARFLFDLEPQLLRLQEGLIAGTWAPGPYRTFEVFEPKPRAICAAPIGDRVVHHAVCNIIGPILDGRSVSDSYACQKGRGTHRALRRAQAFSRRFPYYLRLDVEQFFGSVEHERLSALLARIFKDRRLLAVLQRIVEEPIPGCPPGRGLPIGNLTSQYFANLYLGEVDHLVKDQLGVRGYVRYMDDMLLFGQDKAALHALREQVAAFLEERLALRLGPRGCVLAPVSEGIPFLGMRVFPGMVRLQRRTRVRFCRQVRLRQRRYGEGEIGETELVQSAQSLIGHVRHAATLALRRRLFDTKGGLGQRPSTVPTG